MKDFIPAQSSVDEHQHQIKSRCGAQQVEENRMIFTQDGDSALGRKFQAVKTNRQFGGLHEKISIGDICVVPVNGTCPAVIKGIFFKDVKTGQGMKTVHE